MKLDAMVRQVYAFSGLRTDDPLVTTQMVVDAINSAQQMLAVQAKWPWLRTSTTFDTVVGQVAYAVPADWSETDRIVTPDGDNLVRISAHQSEDDWELDTGEPREFSIDDDQIKLRPIPSTVGTYTHEYLRVMPTLIDDDNESVFPSQYHNVIVEYATARACEIGGAMDRAQACAQRAGVMAVNMRRAVRRERGPQQPRIREGAWI